jgi:AraC-like DNA-binding protein
MNQPYKLHFTQKVQNVIVVPTKSPQSTFSPIQHPRKAFFEKAELYQKQVASSPFYIELVELSTKKLFSLIYEMNSPQYFLLFILEGSITIKTIDDLFACHAKSRHFALIHNEAGKYKMDTIVCIYHLQEYLQKASKNLDLIKSFIEREVNFPFCQLPFCRIDRTVSRHLNNIYLYLPTSKNKFEAQLKYQITMILDQYNLLASQKMEKVSWKVKEYLDQNYTNPDISLQVLADLLQCNIHQVRSKFKTEFGLTPHQYYTGKRLEKALELKTKHKLPLSKIFYQVGYNDESALRYEMKKHGYT